MTKATIVAVLSCVLLAGCGGSATPAAQTKTDSAATTPLVAVPSAWIPPRVTEGGASTPALAAAVHHDTLPAIVTKAFPAAATLERRSEPFPHRVVMDCTGKVLGYEAISDSAGTTARGYAGMVPLQVFFDRRGRPVRIYILDNSETPAYLDLVYRAGLLDTLLRYDPAKPDSVDAVTLATTSSHAIISGVTGLAARVAAEIAAKSRRTR